jgi:hypothetical protein
MMKHCKYGRTLDGAGLKRDQHEGCLRWAFGDDYLELDSVDTPAVWNTRHGDLFEIKDFDNIILTIVNIGEQYLVSGYAEV